MPFPFDIVGFDLDGTLLDTTADLSAALNHALGTLERPAVSLDAARSMIGLGTRVMLERGLAATGGCTPALLDAAYPALLRFYEANIATHTRAYPGAIETLDALASEGVRLAIVTNKPERLAVRLMETLGLADRFACIIGGDTVGVGKPSPKPIREMIRRCGGGNAAFVGDTRYDIEAARAAGIPAIAITFDTPLHAFAMNGADAAIDAFAALPTTLRTLATVSAKKHPARI